MKVAFWENIRPEIRSMDHLAAISIMLSIFYRKKVFLLDNGQDSNSFERVFQGVQRFYYVKEDANYIVHRNGMDSILENLHNTVAIETLLQRSAVELIQDYLYYVPQSKVINHLAYEYQLNQELSTILKIYEKISDLTLIRARNGNNLSTKQVLDEADLVLVELTQDYHVLDEFFDNYSSICHKAIFVFSHYKRNSISIYHIMNKYHLKKEQIVVLTEYHPLNAASVTGNLAAFIKENYNCRKESNHYRCMRELRRAAKMILQYERGELFEKVT